eukprot:TRINITY_DN11465_c0_g1_i2.p1 TRINITY_DN11465_c0_g1~~TRINITY_DN11465_c0_g1_i2.p1  ORF type:complete len:583 (+),score=113.91 TRINITY_DN11465_c0_g1_i2:676-2424(+)
MPPTSTSCRVSEAVRPANAAAWTPQLRISRTLGSPRGMGGLNFKMESNYAVTETGKEVSAGSTTRRTDNILVVVKRAKEQVLGNPMQEASGGEKLENGGGESDAEAAAVVEVDELESGTSERQLDTSEHGRTSERAHAHGHRRETHRQAAAFVEADGHLSLAPLSALSNASSDDRPVDPRPARLIRRKSEDAAKAKADRLEKDTLIMPGDAIAMTLDGWLQHALLSHDREGKLRPFRSLYPDLLSNSASLLDAPNSWVEPNDDANESANQYPTFRMTGLEVVLNLEFNNHRQHKRDDHKDTVLNMYVSANPGWHGRPKTIHIEPLDQRTSKAKVLTSYAHGVRIRIVTGGTFTVVSYAGMIAFLTSFIVFIQMPDMIIGAVALYGMHLTSNFYYYVACERVRMKRSLSGLLARSVGWYYLFSNQLGKYGDGDGDEAEGPQQPESDDLPATLSAAASLGKTSSRPGPVREEISKKARATPPMEAETLCRDMNDALRRHPGASDPFASMLVHEISQVYHDERLSEVQISVDDLCKSATADEPFSIAGFEEIYSAGRQWSFMEKMLLPASEQAMQAPRTRSTRLP